MYLEVLFDASLFGDKNVIDGVVYFQIVSHQVTLTSGFSTSSDVEIDR